jgi:hypothetical protein
VAREQCVEVPVVSERVELATGGDGLAQRLLVMLLVELLKTRLARCLWVKEDVDRVQHGRERLGDVLSQLAMARLNRVACTPGHPRQELAMHLNQVVKCGLLRFGEEAGDERMTLHRPEAP